MNAFCKQHGQVLSQLQVRDKPELVEIVPHQVPYDASLAEKHAYFSIFHRIGGQVPKKTNNKTMQHSDIVKIVETWEGTNASLEKVATHLLQGIVHHIELKSHCQNYLTKALLSKSEYVKQELAFINALNERLIDHYYLCRAYYDLPEIFIGLIHVKQLYQVSPLLIDFKDTTVLTLYYTYAQAHKDFMSHPAQSIAQKPYFNILNDILTSAKRMNSAQSMSLLYLIYGDLSIYINYFQTTLDDATRQFIKTLTNHILAMAKSLLDSIQMELSSGNVQDKLPMHLERIKKFFWGRDVQVWVFHWVLKMCTKYKLQGDKYVDGYFTAVQREALTDVVGDSV